MNLIDLIIIYLACGSPFGAYRATSRQANRNRVDWLTVASSFIFWPVIAIALVAKKIIPNEARAKAEFQNRSESLRIDIEDAAFAGASTPVLFEFRETFARFIGLSEAASVVHRGASHAEIFEITGHPERMLATRCLARRNSNRLSFHQAQARNEFVDLISRLTATTSNRIEITSLALELADHLHDQTAADAFQAMISAPQTRDGEWTSGLEKEVWKSRTPSISTIN